MGDGDEVGQWMGVGWGGVNRRGGRWSSDEGRIGKGEAEDVGVVDVAKTLAICRGILGKEGGKLVLGDPR